MELNAKKQLNAEIPTALHKRLKMVATERDVTIGDAVERAIVEWLDGPRAPGGKVTIQRNDQLKMDESHDTIALITDSERLLIPRILQVLRSGNSFAIDLIEWNLRSTEGLLRTGGTHGRPNAKPPRPNRKTDSA